ncbi:MAG: pyridoxal-phosphate dependent enzyme [Longimicrobiales bacterium]|nr:pyridoxal-phosphate dependent enzyme [Longimicrobiales bacterium]
MSGAPADHGPHPDALSRLAAVPRRRLANLPTPLIPAPRLARALAADPLYLKMDAETGFALGGNKVRKLELELAPERLNGVTHLITAGGPQSNHCRVTAAAAARLGLGCVLVVQGPEPDRPTGNALLHRLFGAEIVTVEDRLRRSQGMDEVARRIRADGGRPLVVPIGASTGLGSLGYALAAVELCRQLDVLDDGCGRTVLFLSSSSGGTLAGLVLGLALLGRTDVELVAVSADAPAGELRDTALRLAAEGAGLLAGEPDLTSVPLTVDDSQVGEGYGIPTTASTSALERFARLEGVVLDPTYTAKAAAGMIAALTAGSAGRGEPGGSRRVVFLHTGGAPGLLA